MFVADDLEKTFSTQWVNMFTVYLRMKFHMPGFNG
jgi:hypothetical protein